MTKYNTTTINVKKVIKDLFGKNGKKSFAKKGEENEDETIGNVILNSLTCYPIQEPEDRKKVFYVQKLGSKILEGMDAPDGKVEIDPKMMEFLDEVMDWATARKIKGKDGKTEETGVYLSFVIAQVLEEMGITE